MAPTVRISDDNWRRLQDLASPFEDSPNDVIGRVLDAVELAGLLSGLKESGKTVNSSSGSRITAAARSRNKRGNISKEVYESAIVETMYELGGEAKAAEVLDKVRDRLKDRIGDFERQRPPTGNEERWRNTARWARNALAEKGLIDRASPHGTWKLTADGISEAKAKLAGSGPG